MQTRTSMTRLLPLLLLGYFFSCEKPTEPKVEQEPDTTSHNFIWEIDTIGYRNITLSDGVIINENDMWVAGDIYPDSASYWNTIHYGLAHWDGEKWTPEIVMARAYPDNQQIKEASVIRDIAYTNDNRLFINTGLLLMEKNGNQWTERAQDIIDGKGFSKIWGNESSNLYIYGSNGGLYHYTGTSLNQILTNTTLDIMDMHGDYNPKTGEYELLALASTDISHLNGSKLLKIKNNNIYVLSVNGINNYSKTNIWFYKGSNYWIVGDGTYFKKSLTDTSWVERDEYPSSDWASIDINGWHPSDVLLTLSDGHLLHYNGASWKDFKPDLNLAGILIGKIIIKNNFILILGGENNSRPKGIIIRGKRLR